MSQSQQPPDNRSGAAKPRLFRPFAGAPAGKGTSAPSVPAAAPPGSMARRPAAPRPFASHSLGGTRPDSQPSPKAGAHATPDAPPAVAITVVPSPADPRESWEHRIPQNTAIATPDAPTVTQETQRIAAGAYAPPPPAPSVEAPSGNDAEITVEVPLFEYTDDEPVRPMAVEDSQALPSSEHGELIPQVGQNEFAATAAQSASPDAQDGSLDALANFAAYLSNEPVGDLQDTPATEQEEDPVADLPDIRAAMEEEEPAADLQLTPAVEEQVERVADLRANPFAAEQEDSLSQAQDSPLAEAEEFLLASELASEPRQTFDAPIAEGLDETAASHEAIESRVPESPYSQTREPVHWGDSDDDASRYASAFEHNATHSVIDEVDAAFITAGLPSRGVASDDALAAAERLETIARRLRDGSLQMRGSANSDAATLAAVLAALLADA